MAKTLSQWWKGTLAFAHIKARELSGQPVLCGQGEAESRAIVCANPNGDDKPCEFNVVPKDVGWAEKWAGGKMREKVEGRRTVNDFKLGICMVCSCELRTLVHFDLGVVNGPVKDIESYPAHCWKRKQPAAE